ncbi:hypothetical protein JDW15_08145 [Aerococcaceae bacterium zg-ZJ1578]|uniref:hypothetical protein n=1 Tax=Aerococcaceae bacterium zg-252 TaxID=2796928 RepID=UPI001A330E51|nr:hypothetical protein [Aerococcaceae bacterium zg-1578]
MKKTLTFILVLLITLVSSITVVASSPSWAYEHISKDGFLNLTSLDKKINYAQVKIFKAGKHKVGDKMPSGIYKVFATDPSGMAYLAILNDSNGNDIAGNSIFSTQSYVQLEDGHKIELRDAIAVPIEQAPPARLFTSVLFDGMFMEGLDFDASEFSVDALSETAYLAVSNIADHSDIESNEIFENNTYVTVGENQFLELRDASINLK